MKKLISALFFVILVAPAMASVCGDGYILTEHKDIEGIAASQCTKLWCRDLETGKTMGNGDKAAPGYVATDYPNELCVGSDCIMCFGARRWCNGEVAGTWNPEYGAYTRGGDNASYESYLRGGCFAWNLEKPRCEHEQTAILKDGRWICAISSESTGGVAPLKSGTRRMGTGGRRIF